MVPMHNRAWSGGLSPLAQQPVGQQCGLPRLRNLHLWFPPYMKTVLARSLRPATSGSRHILFCFVDHFEPFDARRTMAQNDQIVNEWLKRYPELCARHVDSDNVMPQHTWFYPGERYYPEYLEALCWLAQKRLGEIELHLHHDGDNEQSLRALLELTKSNFARHGALTTAGPISRVAYAFIHGNSALCNSRRGLFCGVNDELRILHETGCFADFSFPTYPSESQPRKVNSMYYASSSPNTSRGFDHGRDIKVGKKERGHLLLIQGPLALTWRSRRYGILPRVDVGDITGHNPPTPARVQTWVRQRIGVKGRPEWVFIKVSCHGAQAADMEALLGEPADNMYRELERLFRERPGYQLHYVTAREMYNIAKAAEAGCADNPNLYRDYIIPPYKNRSEYKVIKPCVELQES